MTLSSTDPGGSGIPDLSMVSWPIGWLFLDRRIRKNVLDGMRQPMERKHARSADRREYQDAYPSDFILVAAMNPVHAGIIGPGNAMPNPRSKYLGKISGM